MIAQTRLVQTADLTTRLPLDPPVDIARYDGIVETVAEAMSYIPVAERPTDDLNNYGGFRLEYDLDVAVDIDVLGTHQATDRNILSFADVWLTAASRDASDPAYLRESFQTIYGDPLPTPRLVDNQRKLMRDTIVNHALQGRTGDLRDSRLIELAQETDTTGMMNAIRNNLNGPDEWDEVTGNETAPLYTKVPK